MLEFGELENEKEKFHFAKRSHFMKKRMNLWDVRPHNIVTSHVTLWWNSFAVVILYPFDKKIVNAYDTIHNI